MSAAPLHPVMIRRAGAEAIATLQPLWISLHDHHVAVAIHLRELGPVRRAEESWRVRSTLHEEWLAEPDAFVMVAEIDGSAVGYALVHMRGEEESWQTGLLRLLPGRYPASSVGRSSRGCRLRADLAEHGGVELEVPAIKA
jgi:hypothetical protein